MTTVSNTGPLIALAKVDQLPLLERLFGQVHIPPIVHRELLAKAGSEAARLDQALATFIVVTERPDMSPIVEAATARINAGEQQAIALADSMESLLLMDDRLGRQAARRLKLDLTGTVGLLMKAEDLGLVASAALIVEEMRVRGYWLSGEVAGVVGEQAPNAVGLHGRDNVGVVDLLAAHRYLLDERQKPQRLDQRPQSS